MARLDRGTYQLRIRITSPLEVAVGKLGIHLFTPGTYIYTGRAGRGLSQRIERHRRKDTPSHWHIDYLTNHPDVSITGISIVSPDPNRECAVTQELIEQKKGWVPVRGFGSSDCRAGCPAHLVKLGV